MSSIPTELQKRLRSRAGFTLIELLVVAAILGILGAIAIQQFISYRSRAIDTEMRSDLRNAAISMESYFAENRVYPTTVSNLTSVGFRQTDGVSLTITITSPNTFSLTASKPDGTQASFTYDSTTGAIN